MKFLIHIKNSLTFLCQNMLYEISEHETFSKLNYYKSKNNAKS